MNFCKRGRSQRQLRAEEVLLSNRDRSTGVAKKGKRESSDPAALGNSSWWSLYEREKGSGQGGLRRKKRGYRNPDEMLSGDGLLLEKHRGGVCKALAKRGGRRRGVGGINGGVRSLKNQG